MEAARRVFCVTGGTGFLGVAVVRILLSKGHRVRVIVRTADHVLAATPGIEMHLGSINDEPFMERVCEGAHGIFHLAGIVEHSRSSTANVYRINVDGTRSVMRAAAKHGLKVVLTSTSGTVAVSRRPEVRGDANGYARGVIDNWPYYDSKREGEEVARRIAAERGVRLVILRPTSIAGPGEASLPAAKSLEYYRHKSVYKHLARKVPYVPGGGLSLCDVRDVAEAHCRAMETPAADGGAFCLGGRPDANMTLKAFFDLLEQLSGVPRTRLEVPYLLGWGALAALHAVTRAAGRPYHVDPVVVEMANHFWYVDSGAAARALGYAPRPARETLRDTLDYLYAHERALGLPRRLPPRGGAPRARL